MAITAALGGNWTAVPQDIALVGFDDIEDGRYSTPSFTMISPDKTPDRPARGGPAAAPARRRRPTTRRTVRRLLSRGPGEHHGVTWQSESAGEVGRSGTPKQATPTS